MSRKYTINPAKPPGRKPGRAAHLARKLGISRQAAWFKLNRATGKPTGRPKRVNHA